MLSSKKIHILFFLIALVASYALCTNYAQGVERFPPPEFSNHKLPQTTVPPPRGQIYEYIDITVLIIALSVAAYLVLKKRSRRGIFWLTVFSVLYFGFWRRGCVCSVGALQNITLGFFDKGYSIPVVILFFFFTPLMFSLFFGRVFCSSVCPLGAIQDLVLVQPIAIPSWLGRTLELVAYLYLAMAVLFAATGSAFIICDYDPFISFFRLSGSLPMLVLGFAFLGISLFIGRPYCRFLCPYGVILKQFSRFSKWNVNITPEKCIQCGLCGNACPFDAIDAPYQAPPAESCPADKKRLVWTMSLSVLIIPVLGWVGRQLAQPLAQMHPTIQLAQRISEEKAGLVKGTTNASDAFWASGKPVKELYAKAHRILHEYRTGSTLLGVFMGVVIFFRLIGFTIKRTRTEYTANRGRCLACGRCYDYCPVKVENTNCKN